MPPRNEWHKLKCTLYRWASHRSLFWILVLIDSLWIREYYREKHLLPASCTWPIPLAASLIKGWNYADSRQEQVLVSLQNRPPWDTNYSLCLPRTQQRISETFFWILGSAGSQDWCSDDICESTRYFLRGVPSIIMVGREAIKTPATRCMGSIKVSGGEWCCCLP